MCKHDLSFGMCGVKIGEVSERHRLKSIGTIAVCQSVGRFLSVVCSLCLTTSLSVYSVYCVWWYYVLMLPLNFKDFSRALQELCSVHCLCFLLKKLLKLACAGFSCLFFFYSNKLKPDKASKSFLKWLFCL